MCAKIQQVSFIFLGVLSVEDGRKLEEVTRGVAGDVKFAGNREMSTGFSCFWRLKWCRDLPAIPQKIGGQLLGNLTFLMDLCAIFESLTKIPIFNSLFFYLESFNNLFYSSRRLVRFIQLSPIFLQLLSESRLTVILS